MTAPRDRPRRYRDDGQRRWERLKAEMVASGAVAAEQLDSSPESLRMVWEYVLPRLRRRAPDEPADPAQQPPWWDGPMWRMDTTWDDGSHDLIGAVAYYFGEVRVRRPGASWGVGPPGTADAGEPVIVGEREDINPLGMVLNALGDVWEGREDRDALMRLALYVPEPLPLELLYPTRLVLRLRGKPVGLLRRRGSLDAAGVVGALRRLLDVEGAGPAEVALSPAGTTEADYRGEWRAGVEVDGAAGAVREVRTVIGAGWSEPRPSQLTREQMRAFVDGFVGLAAEFDGEVDILHAQPNDLHAPRPSGVLTPDRVLEVLDAIELGPHRRRR